MIQHVMECIELLERLMVSLHDAYAVPHEAGAFMHALILATGAEQGLEIGTSYGYSGLWIASALMENGGRLITLDHDPRKSESARTTFDSAGLAGIVELRTGEALDILPTLNGPFDFVLNDADKVHVARYVDILADKLSDRAVVLTDNTVTHAEQLAEFVSWIRGRKDFQSAHVPAGNGMEMSVKRVRSCFA